MLDGNDQREFTRAQIHVEADICCGEEKIHGHVVDLGLRGLFLRCRNQLPEKTACGIEIYLAGDAMRIGARGEITRSLENGLAVEFTEIDLDSFEHLRSLIRFHAENCAQVDREFKNHLGLKRPDKL